MRRLSLLFLVVWFSGLATLALGCGDGGGGDTDAGTVITDAGGGGTDASMSADAGSTSDGGSASDGGGTDDGGGSDTDGGSASDGGSDTDAGMCTRPVIDTSALGMTCTGDGMGSCPAGYTCQPFSGFVLAHDCQILCEDDCDCPSATRCETVSDKGSTWQCNFLPD